MLGTQSPGNKPSFLKKVLIGAAILLILAPIFGAALYRSAFGYHWIAIPFAAFALLFVLSAIGLVTVLINASAKRNPIRLSALFCGLVTAVAVAILCCIYAAAFASHSAWGDAVSFSLVRTFIFYPSSSLNFLPISNEYRASILIWTALVIALAFVIIIALLLTLARPVASVIHAQVSKGKRQLTVVVAALVVVGAVSAGFCVTLLTTHRHLLEGEPLSAFLELAPTSRLMAPDNARMIAATEDRDARLKYKVAPNFKPRNVVLIISDALRADRLGVYGYGRPTTPFLSDLHSSNKLHRVEMALSTCSETYCSVASTLASRPYHQISPFNFKLHSLLRDAGYRINFFLTGDHRTWSYLSAFYGSDIDAVFDFFTLKARDMHDDRNLIAALEEVPPSTGAPNFFYFFLMSSHVSGSRLPEFDRFKPSFSDNMRLLSFWNELAGIQRVGQELKNSRLTSQDFEAISNRYDNGVLQTDYMIKRIFDALSKKGYLKDSIVVIVGDHGDGLGEHRHVGHTRYLYQEDIRIPLLIYEGGTISAHDVYKNDAYATLIDVAPTIVDRLGLTVPKSWQGRSLLAPPPRDRITFHQTRRGRDPCFAAVEKAGSKLMKYIRCGSGNDAREELFDLVADPHERTNLVDQVDAAVLRRYRREIDSRFAIVTNSCMAFECRD